MRSLVVVLILSLGLAGYVGWSFWSASRAAPWAGGDKSQWQAQVPVPRPSGSRTDQNFDGPQQSLQPPSLKAGAPKSDLAGSTYDPTRAPPPSGLGTDANSDGVPQLHPSPSLKYGAPAVELRGILARDPYNERALRDALEQARSQQRWHDAAEAGARLLVLDPNADALRAERAAALLRLARFDEAAQELQELARRRVSDADVWFNLATALELAGDRFAALDAWGRTADLAPADAEPRLRRGDLYRRMAAWQSAIQDLEIAAALRPHDPSIALSLAECCEEIGEWARAESVLAAAQEAHARDIRIWNRRAELAWRDYLRTDSVEARDRAVSAWQASLRIAPGQEDLRAHLALALAK